MLSGFDFVWIGAGAMAAGAVNALAGGGTLISFPMLTAVGLPAMAANITNTVALCPGYLGATLAQKGDLAGQKRRLRWHMSAGILGGIVGGWLLLNTDERAFRSMVPFLILAASGLLALQGPVRGWLMRRSERTGSKGIPETLAAPAVGLAAVYGGYFGAGLSVIVLAVLGLFLEDNLTRLNALKQATALATNVAAAVFFLFSHQVVWSAAVVMAVGALIGGALGGRLAGRIKPDSLQAIVVVIGVLVALIYLLR